MLVGTKRKQIADSTAGGYGGKWNVSLCCRRRRRRRGCGREKLLPPASETVSLSLRSTYIVLLIEVISQSVIYVFFCLLLSFCHVVSCSADGNVLLVSCNISNSVCPLVLGKDDKFLEL